MKALLFLLLATVSTLAQFGSESIRPWEPRDIRTKAGLFAQYDVGQASTVTLNGSGISKVADKSWVPGRLENLLVQSEAFSTTWLRVQLNAFGAVDTGAAGAGSFANTARTTDPLGGNTADFIQEDATAGNPHLITQTCSGAASVPCVLEFRVKPAGRTWCLVLLADGAVVNSIRAYFNLSGAGAVGTVSNGGSATGATGAITALANGWYLCRLSGTPASSGTGLYVGLYLAAGDLTHSYNGDNTSGLFIWGAQLRRATSSSTYVATTTVAEDASRDLLQSTAANQPIYDTTNTLNGKATAYFDGYAHYLKTAGMASLVQPETGVLVGKQVTWTGGDIIFDGNATQGGQFYQSAVKTSPIVSLFAGTRLDETGNFSVGSLGVASCVFNGANSSLQINNTGASVGNAGANNLGGLTLGAIGSGASGFGNIQVQHILLFNKVLATPELDYVKYGGLRDVGALP